MKCECESRDRKFQQRRICLRGVDNDSFGVRWFRVYENRDCCRS